MELRLGVWRLPADYAMTPGATNTFHRLLDVGGAPEDLEEVLADKNQWEVASHTLTPDGPDILLSVMFVRYPPGPGSS